MATTEVIHEHDTHAADNTNGISFLIGVIVLAAVVFFMIYFGLNLFRGMSTSSPSIQVPDKINVNVQGQGGK